MVRGRPTRMLLRRVCCFVRTDSHDRRSVKLIQKESFLMKEAVIVADVRTAVGKAPRGTLRATRAQELGLPPLARFVSFAVGGVPLQN